MEFVNSKFVGNRLVFLTLFEMKKEHENHSTAKQGHTKVRGTKDYLPPQKKESFSIFFVNTTKKKKS